MAPPIAKWIFDVILISRVDLSFKNDFVSCEPNDRIEEIKQDCAWSPSHDNQPY
jgi:hypothetical protein